MGWRRVEGGWGKGGGRLRCEAGAVRELLSGGGADCVRRCEERAGGGIRRREGHERGWEGRTAPLRLSPHGLRGLRHRRTATGGQRTGGVGGGAVGWTDERLRCSPPSPRPPSPIDHTAQQWRCVADSGLRAAVARRAETTCASTMAADHEGSQRRCPPAVSTGGPLWPSQPLRLSASLRGVGQALGSGALGPRCSSQLAPTVWRFDGWEAEQPRRPPELSFGCSDGLHAQFP